MTVADGNGLRRLQKTLCTISEFFEIHEMSLKALRVRDSVATLQHKDMDQILDHAILLNARKVYNPLEKAAKSLVRFGCWGKGFKLGIATLRALVCAGFVVALCSTTVAQEPVQPSPEQVGCELHVWPGNDLRSTYHGWFHGGIVDGAVQGREGYRQLPEAPLSTATQSETLKQLPLADLLGLPGHRVVLHDTPLDSRTLRATAGRISQSNAPCYAELAVDDVFFQEDIVNGRFMKALLRFRQFNEGESPSRQFGTYIQEKLLIFPQKKPGEDPRKGLDELSDAFRRAITAFGQALSKPARRK
ncbi:MAG: hypothetical protein R3D83_07485 [Caenibius sp.]